jgi:hypothetical protein
MQRRKFNGKILWWSLNLVEEDGDGQSTPKNRKILQKKLQLFIAFHAVSGWCFRQNQFPNLKVQLACGFCC